MISSADRSREHSACGSLPSLASRQVRSGKVAGPKRSRKAATTSSRARFSLKAQLSSLGTPGKPWDCVGTRSSCRLNYVETDPHPKKKQGNEPGDGPSARGPDQAIRTARARAE